MKDEREIERKRLVRMSQPSDDCLHLLPCKAAFFSKFSLLRPIYSRITSKEVDGCGGEREGEREGAVAMVAIIKGRDGVCSSRRCFVRVWGRSSQISCTWTKAYFLSLSYSLRDVLRDDVLFYFGSL